MRDERLFGLGQRVEHFEKDFDQQGFDGGGDIGCHLDAGRSAFHQPAGVVADLDNAVFAGSQPPGGSLRSE